MQTRNNIIRIALFAAMTGAFVSGCSKPESKKAKPEATAAAADSSAAADEKLPFNLREGKRLFNHYCAICHSETGDGTGQYYGFGLSPTPANFTDKAFMKTMSDDHLFKAISEGSVGVGKSNMCPPWGKTFDKDEIDCMIIYIRTFTGN
jgi:mono/diheme cytochrome c family protein